MTWDCRYCAADRETADEMVDHLTDDHEVFDLRFHARKREEEVPADD